MKPSRDIAGLIAIMAALRTPGSGCPWDLEQNFATIAPYTIEEAYEVADAIGRGDLDDLKDELGDLLLQVVFHARMAEEQGTFAFADVVQAITEKLIRRHPHVFGDKGGLNTGQVNVQWDQIKAEEKAARAKAGSAPAPGRDGALAGVSPGLPALGARTQAAAESRQGRLRLERSEGGAGEDPRGSRRDRRGARGRRDRTRSRARSATCCSPWSTSRAISMSIPRARCARPT